MLSYNEAALYCTLIKGMLPPITIVNFLTKTIAQHRAQRQPGLVNSGLIGANAVRGHRGGMARKLPPAGRSVSVHAAAPPPRGWVEVGGFYE